MGKRQNLTFFFGAPFVVLSYSWLAWLTLSYDIGILRMGKKKKRKKKKEGRAFFLLKTDPSMMGIEYSVSAIWKDFWAFIMMKWSGHRFGRGGPMVSCPVVTSRTRRREATGEKRRFFFFSLHPYHINIIKTSFHLLFFRVDSIKRKKRSLLLIRVVIFFFSSLSYHRILYHLVD